MGKTAIKDKIMKIAALIFSYGIRLYLYTRYYLEKATRTGGFSNPGAVYIKQPDPVSGNALKDLLFKYHVKQFHESSCSVASVVNVVNALLEHQGKTMGEPLTQHDLLDKVTAAHWKERMSDDGYNGKRGLPLEILGQVVQQSLDNCEISYGSVETVSAVTKPGGTKQFKKDLYHRLERFEKNGDCLIICHFNQGRFLPELHIPHISPVGGFDPASARVTMLDVDPVQKWPYQISFETFYRGISCNYNNVFRPFGYAGGGYIYIRL